MHEVFTVPGLERAGEEQAGTNANCKDGPETITLQVEQDCYVHYENLNGNIEKNDNKNGNDLFIGINNESDDSLVWYEKMRAYLYFSILQEVPQGAIVVNATLNLYVKDQKGLKDWMIQVYNAQSSWAENSITWDNKPGGSNQTEIHGPWSSGWFDLDVTSNVQAIVDSGDNHGLYLRSEQESNANVEGLKAYFRVEDKPSNNKATMEIEYVE